jgi:hypothetical protein
MPHTREVFGVLLLLAVPAIGVVLLQLAIAGVGFSALGIIRFARSFLGKTGSPSRAGRG